MLKEKDKLRFKEDIEHEVFDTIFDVCTNDFKFNSELAGDIAKIGSKAVTEALKGAKV
jgi:hypothetical protein